MRHVRRGATSAQIERSIIRTLFVRRRAYRIVHPASFMLTTEFSIPVSVDVSITDVLQGIFEIEGLLTYADEELTMEYQSKELLSRGSKVTTVELQLDELRDVQLKKGLTGPKITLRPRRLSAFADVPIASNAEIVLKVKWGNRKEAEALVSHLQRVLSYKSIPGEISRIPFRGPDVGLREIKGALYLEDDEFLVIDVENALAGEFDTKRQLIKIAPRALRDVRLDERRFHDRLFIRPKSRDLLEAMPGSYHEELELKIRPKYRDAVERLLYELKRLSSRERESDDEQEDPERDSEPRDAEPDSEPRGAEPDGEPRDAEPDSEPRDAEPDSEQREP